MLSKFIVLLSLLVTFYVFICLTPDSGEIIKKVYSQELKGLNNPIFLQSPVIKWGNTSYHDSLGTRDPFIFKEGEVFYLYYDCMEQMYNPSFESNLETNGWDTYHASISSTNEMHYFGERSLKVITDGSVLNAGAFTGKYYYQNLKNPENLAGSDGLEVTPNTNYIASAYFWADFGTTVELWIQQYKDDPGFYNQNVLSTLTQKIRMTGNNSWQRIAVKFTTGQSSKAITISFAIPETKVTTTYWDGVQMEKVANENSPSDFPTDQNYNQKIEDILGWRTCLAVSNDGINFSKKGPVIISGTKGAWENYEKPGYVGSSNTYANVFKSGNNYYAYVFEGGYALGTTFSFDNVGIPGIRNPYYQDRRTQAPNGNNRSGLLMATNPYGPYTRISQTNPIIIPPDFGDTNPNSCRQQYRTCSSTWGCEYLTSIGVPFYYNNKWIIYLAGQTYYQKGIWEGTLGGGGTGCHAITAGYAVSDSPLGPWVQWSNNPIFNPQDLLNFPVSRGDGGYGTALEGPVYYYDQGGYYFLFLNAISGGAHAVEAFWTRDPLDKWPILTNRKTIITWDQIPWSIGTRGYINLATITESTDKKKLFLYYGARANTDNENYRSYLFHDIGLITYPLPLLTAPTPILTPTPTVIPTYTPTSIPTIVFKIGWNQITTTDFTESNLGTNCDKYTMLKGYWDSGVVGYSIPLTVPLFSGKIHVQCK